MVPSQALWTRFRTWPWWGQTLLWIVWPIPLVLYALSKPPGNRRWWWAVAAAGTSLFVALAVSNPEDPAPTEVAAATEEAPAGSTTTTTASTTTTLPKAPEGGYRAGSGKDDTPLSQPSSSLRLRTPTSSLPSSPR